MAGQKGKENKEESRLYFCSLCSYIAETYEELDLHYELSHSDPDDSLYEFEIMLQNTKPKKKKVKSLKERAIKELKLLIEGRTFKEEYIGTCFQRYYIGRLGNTITLLPYATIC